MTNFLFTYFQRYIQLLWMYFDIIEIRNIFRMCIYSGIDAPALIPLNLCDFLRDPKGQL